MLADVRNSTFVLLTTFEYRLNFCTLNASTTPIPKTLCVSLKDDPTTMSEDNLYLLFCYLLFGLTLCILTIRSKNRLKTITTNLIIAGLYSGLFFYNLTFNGSGGSGLVWLVYLMFSVGLH